MANPSIHSPEVEVRIRAIYRLSQLSADAQLNTSLVPHQILATRVTELFIQLESLFPVWEPPMSTTTGEGSIAESNGSSMGWNGEELTAANASEQTDSAQPASRSPSTQASHQYWQYTSTGYPMTNPPNDAAVHNYPTYPTAYPSTTTQAGTMPQANTTTAGLPFSHMGLWAAEHDSYPGRR